MGPKLALTILSQLTADALVACIQHEDIASFTSIAGVGPKLARRLCLELSGKLTGFTLTHNAHEHAAPYQDDLRSALLNLGFALVEINRILPKLAFSGNGLQRLAQRGPQSPR